MGKRWCSALLCLVLGLGWASGGNATAAEREWMAAPPPATRIVISLGRQVLWLYVSGRLRLHTLVTTGQPGLATPVGNYRVLGKLSPFTFIAPARWPKGSPHYYPPSRVHYAMLFLPSPIGSFYIHDAPWRTSYGPNVAPRTRSHGCVNVTLRAMKVLWTLTPAGTEVDIVR